PSGDSIEHSTPQTEAIVIDRKVFDAALADRAERAGATVQIGERITSVRVVDDGVWLTTSRERRIAARACVLACGANYALHKRLGLRPPAVHFQAAAITRAAGRPR